MKSTEIIMLKIQFIVYILAITFLKSVALQSGLQSVFWELKPFFYIENGEQKGMIANYFHQLRKYCSSSQQVLNLKSKQQNHQRFINLLNDLSKKYKTDELLNVTKEKAAWFPIVTMLNETVTIERNLKQEVLLFSPNIAVIVKREKILWQYKFAIGLYNCRHIVVITVIVAVFYAMSIWLTESFNNKDFNKSFTIGSGTGFWLACIAMTTVGFGDIVPRSMIGRFITILWTLIGLTIAALLTANITDSISGTSYLDISKENIAALANSYEFNAVARDYNSVMKGYNSYKEVADAIRYDNSIYAGIMNSDVTSYIQQELRSDVNKAPLAIVQLLPLDVPVSFLQANYIDLNFTQCSLIYGKQIMDASMKKYRQLVKLDTVHIEDLLDFFKNNDYIKYPCISIATLILCGIIYDIITKVRLCRVRKKYEGNAEVGHEVVQNGSAKISPPKSSKDDMAKLRKDIETIKDSIVKLSAMTSYKQKCPVCSWQT